MEARIACSLDGTVVGTREVVEGPLSIEYRPQLTGGADHPSLAPGRWRIDDARLIDGAVVLRVSPP